MPKGVYKRKFVNNNIMIANKNKTLTYDFLYKNYILENKSTYKISLICGYSSSTVYNYLKHFKIKIRLKSELKSRLGVSNKTKSIKISPEERLKRKKLSMKKWKQSDKGKMSQHRHNIIQRTNRRDLSVKTIQLVYEDNIKKYGTLTCYLCLKSIEFKKDHLEHKTPLSRGGSNLYENLGIACQKCNLKKHKNTEEEYKERILTHASQS